MKFLTCLRSWLSTLLPFLFAPFAGFCVCICADFVPTHPHVHPESHWENIWENARPCYNEFRSFFKSRFMLNHRPLLVRKIKYGGCLHEPLDNHEPSLWPRTTQLRPWGWWGNIPLRPTSRLKPLPITDSGPLRWSEFGFKNQTFVILPTVPSKKMCSHWRQSTAACIKEIWALFI